MQEVNSHFEISSASALSRRSPSEKACDESATVNPREVSSLVRIVETDISSCLLTVNQPASAKLMPNISDSRFHADMLANLVLRDDSDEAWAFVEALARNGVAPRTIMNTFIASAARRLGELWEIDACDFMQVTVGMQLLQGLLRNLDPEGERGVDRTRKAPTILLLAAPGENHLLGIQMAAGLFASEGWSVERADAEACSRRLSEQWFDAIGFSVNCERFFDGLRLTIAQARVASQNPRLRVLVGGSIFASGSEFGQKMGADEVAPDFETAIYLARTLL
jgi:methanogenic corrinoid protein MtbC1